MSRVEVSDLAGNLTLTSTAAKLPKTDYRALMIVS